ncbi:MAG: hypothetical protein ACOCU1_01740 [Bacillota bacterium]
MKKTIVLLLFMSLITLLHACNTGPYTVTFVNYDDTVLKEITIEDGERANAPSTPFKFGHTFKSWDHDLDAIDEDTVIKPIYEPITFETSLHELVYHGKYESNITEETMVYANGKKTQDKLYKLTNTDLYSMFQLTEDDHRVDLYMIQDNDTFTGYQLNPDDACWMYTEITEDIYNHSVYTHSTRAMLPHSFNLEWFTKDGNAYTLKREHYQDIYDASDMTGEFNHYRITELDDAFELYIEIFRDGESIEYFITYTNMGTTTNDFDSFETCSVN